MLELFIGSYSLIGIGLARAIAGHLAYTWMEAENRRYYTTNSIKPSGDHWFGASALGFIAGIVWPLVALVYAISSLPIVLVGQEKAQRQKRINEYTEELERDVLDLDDPARGLR